MEYAAVYTVRGVKFHYEPGAEITDALSLFRRMVNDAIRTCIDCIRGRLHLRNRIYREFMDRHNIPSVYPCSVSVFSFTQFCRVLPMTDMLTSFCASLYGRRTLEAARA